MVFEILSFNLYLEEERQLWTTVWMQAYHNEKMKELVYPPPNTLGQSDSSVEKKMVNDWAETWKLLRKDRKYVVLYTVTI